MNPWLLVPPTDYEGHMGSPEVGQLAVLGGILREDLRRLRPTTLAVLGCATGNGFEHIEPALTTCVLGLDLNPEYLEIARARHAGRLPGLELVQGDVAEAELPAGAFDLVHAGLLFEYVEPARSIPRIARWLRPGGWLTVVLQEPSASTAAVTPTPYRSLQALAPVLRLVDAEAFAALAGACGLAPAGDERIPLPGGKSFRVLRYRSSTSEEG